MQFWTSKEDIHGYEFDTAEAAEMYLNEQYAEHCQSECPRNGEVFCDTMILVRYDFETDEILEEKEIVLEYEHYHGDRAEHETW